jgi:hypothetical protein
MTKVKLKTAVAGDAAEKVTAKEPTARTTRSQTMIDLLRAESGASAAELSAAVGWQVHSVRGFIAGTLKKRSDLIVTAERKDGVTRYRVADRAPAAA